MTLHPFTTTLATAAAALTVALAALVAPAQDGAPAHTSQDTAPDGIAVANLLYDGGRSGVCFADQFLDLYARNTGQDVVSDFALTEIGGDELFNYPFVVFTGEKEFTLSDDEKENLKAYLDRGGFVLASAGCSNRAWADSFRALIADLYGDDALTPLTTEHAMFHTLYDINTIEVRRVAQEDAVFGLVIDDRVRLVFTPIGLNDTGNAGAGCCCCGGDEIRNARLINANILAYALTH